MLSAVDELDHYQLYDDHCYSIKKIFSNVGRVTGIALRNSNVTITHSRFEGNNVGLIGAVIFIESNSDIIIVNSSFANNNCYSASTLYDYVINCLYDCYSITNSIMHTVGHGNTVKIYDTKFMQNEGVILFKGETLNVIIAHMTFMNNVVYSAAIVCVIDSNLTVSHSTFNNNTGRILRANSTEVSIRHSEFLCNNGSYHFDGVLATIDHSNFINNTSPGSMLWVTAIANRTEVSISYSEFLCNNGGNRLYYFDGVLATNIDHNKFINNTNPGSMLYITAKATNNP